MTGVTKQDCPYCKTQNVAFTAVTDWKVTAGGHRSLFRCGSCNEGVIWEYLPGGPKHPKAIEGDIARANILLAQQWPKPESGSAPEDTPATVARFFEQGTSSLEAGNFDAAGMMFRKTLESATKLIDMESTRSPLAKRIDALARSGKLTPDLAEWAHEVRLAGNDAAHEDEPFTKEDAEDLRNFIENFLRYAFTLPSAVKRRAKPAASSAS